MDNYYHRMKINTDQVDLIFDLKNLNCKFPLLAVTILRACPMQKKVEETVFAFTTLPTVNFLIFNSPKNDINFELKYSDYIRNINTFYIQYLNISKHI